MHFNIVDIIVSLFESFTFVVLINYYISSNKLNKIKFYSTIFLMCFGLQICVLFLPPNISSSISIIWEIFLLAIVFCHNFKVVLCNYCIICITIIISNILGLFLISNLMHYQNLLQLRNHQLQMFISGIPEIVSLSLLLYFRKYVYIFCRNIINSKKILYIFQIFVQFLLFAIVVTIQFTSQTPTNYKLIAIITYIILFIISLGFFIKYYIYREEKLKVMQQLQYTTKQLDDLKSQCNDFLTTLQGYVQLQKYDKIKGLVTDMMDIVNKNPKILKISNEIPVLQISLQQLVDKNIDITIDNQVLLDDLDMNSLVLVERLNALHECIDNLSGERKYKLSLKIRDYVDEILFIEKVDLKLDKDRLQQVSDILKIKIRKNHTIIKFKIPKQKNRQVINNEKAYNKTNKCDSTGKSI